MIDTGKKGNANREARGEGGGVSHFLGLATDAKVAANFSSLHVFQTDDFPLPATRLGHPLPSRLSFLLPSGNIWGKGGG